MNTIIHIPKTHLVIREAVSEETAVISSLIHRNVIQIHSAHYTKRQIQIWQNGYTEETIKTQIEQRPVFVLECNNVICGTIQLAPQHPEIKGFYLDPDYTDKGLGNVLFDFLISFLKRANNIWVELTCNQWTAPFYQKQKFKFIRKEIVCWQNEPFEEWSMRRTF